MKYMTSSVSGSLPKIIKNKNNVYKGDLVHYFQAVFYHAQNLSNPYHNFRHVSHTLWLCYQACVFYKDTLSKRDMRNLLIASLFHDFDHRGMATNDKINIEKAVTGLKTHIAPEDEKQLGEIEQLIRSTEYPHLVSSESLNLQGKILRDADLSQAFSVAWVQQVIFGFAKEWDKTPIEVFKLQEGFLNTIKFQTKWAKEMFPKEKIQEKISEVQEFIELLKKEGSTD